MPNPDKELTVSHDTQVKQEAPERIWISSDRALKWTDYAFDGGIEYVRADLLATVRREVWNEAIRAAQISAKKSQVAGLNIAAAEILIRRLERASATKKEGMNG